MPRTPREMNGAPTTAKIPTSSAKTAPAASTSGMTDRSASATYMVGSTRTNSDARISSVVERATDVAGGAPMRPPTIVAPMAASSASASEMRAPNSSAAEHVAAVAVGAEQQQRRARLSSGRAHQVSPAEPGDRDGTASILLVALLELAEAASTDR